MFRLLLLFLLIAASPAGAADGKDGERRIALVIGNAAYPEAVLRNAVNDARDMAAALRKLGFEVIEKHDASQKEMNRAIVQFGEKLRSDAVALFYYAGHGMQVKGKNYLVPVDAQITSEASARAESVDIDAVMDQLSASPLNIVILDACRNNPFERRFRSAGGGLAQMDAPKGSLIAYATAPGRVASDGAGRNGLYTQELLKNIQTPGLPLEAVFKRVRNGVMTASGEEQTPWESSSLTGDFYFMPAAAPREQAGIDKDTLLQALKAQQATTDRAVEDALRKANEQAARERLELQKSMEKMLQEALARQAAQLDAERASRKALDERTPQAVDLAPVAVPAPPPEKLTAYKPTPPAPTASFAGEAAAQLGEEWEYATHETMFGKRGKLVMRVKAIAPQGVLEEVLWNGERRLEWVFGNNLAAIGMPNEAEFLIAPHWKGEGLRDIQVEGGVGWWTASGNLCHLYGLKIVGREELLLGPGKFEALRIKGYIRGQVLARGGAQGEIEFWYSTKLGRLLKQRALFRGQLQKFDETIELTAIRPASH